MATNDTKTIVWEDVTDQNDRDGLKALVSILREEGGRWYAWCLPTPASYGSNTKSVVDQGTSISGHFLGSIVRDDVAHISMSWSYLSAEDWALINQLFRSETAGADVIHKCGNTTLFLDQNGQPAEHSGFINRVRFYDQTMARWNEREMYISDRGAGLWRMNQNGGVAGWLDCSLDLTEV